MKTKNLETNDNFILRTSNYLIEKGWSPDSSFFFTLTGFLFIWSLFIQFFITFFSFTLQLENAIQNVQVTLIINSFLFILVAGTYIIHLFENKK